MSTASKVLTVLVMLAMIGWMVLMSAVATLNRGYGEKIVADDKKIATQIEEIAAKRIELGAAERAFARAEEDANRAAADGQRRRDQLTTLFAQTSETKDRLDLQREAMEQVSTEATANRDFRKNELTGLNEEIAKKGEESKAIQQLNTQKRQELDALQKRFRDVTQQNRSALSASR